MITAPIPPWPPLDNEIKESLEKAYLKGEWGKYEGENCSELIEAIGQAFLADFVYLCCSGTFAAELALRALNLEPGDEVILAAYDFPGNFRAIEAVGATPVLVDLAEGHWYLDPKEVEKAVSPRTKGLFVSHLYGDLAPMDEILQITVDKGVAVIEDCCQVPGTKWDGKPIGSFGDLAILSFGGSKPLTSGRGGGVLCSNPLFHQRMKRFCQRGNEAYPLSELQAAALLPQVKRVFEASKSMMDNGLEVIKESEEWPYLTSFSPNELLEKGAQTTFYKLPFFFGHKWGNGQSSDWENQDDSWREKFVQLANNKGLMVGKGYQGFHKRPPSRCRKIGNLENSRRAAKCTILLHHPLLRGSKLLLNQVISALGELGRTVPKF